MQNEFVNDLLDGEGTSNTPKGNQFTNDLLPDATPKPTTPEPTTAMDFARVDYPEVTDPFAQSVIDNSGSIAPQLKSALIPDEVNKEDYFKQSLGMPGISISPDVKNRMSKLGMGPKSAFIDEAGNPVNAQGDVYGQPGSNPFTPRPEVDRTKYWEQGKPADYKGDLISQGLDLISSSLGIPIDKDKISPEIAAQASVEFGAKQAGVSVSEYRQSPEFIEKVSNGFVNAVGGGFLNAIDKSSGLDQYEPSALGRIGESIGSVGGFLLGPAKIASGFMSPLTSLLPETGTTVVDTLTNLSPNAKIFYKMGVNALGEALVLGPATGLSNVWGALNQTSFTDAGKEILKNTLSGSAMGTIFGVVKGALPMEWSEPGGKAETATRLGVGLMALNAQKAIESGGSPFANRPAGEVAWSILMDAVFLAHGIPDERLKGYTESIEMIAKHFEDMQKAEDGYNTMFPSDPADFIVKPGEPPPEPADPIARALKAKIDQQRKTLDIQLEQTAKAMQVDVEGREDWLMKQELLAQRRSVPIEYATPEMKDYVGNMPEKKDIAKVLVDIPGDQVAAVESPPVELPKPKGRRKKIISPKVEPEVNQVPPSEPVNEVDLSTGRSDVPESHSIFEKTLDESLVSKKTFDENPKSVSTNIEVAIAKFANDVNLWRHGDDSIDIDLTRNILSRFVKNAETQGLKPGTFDSKAQEQAFIETMKETATWARGTDRLKIEPTVESSVRSKSKRSSGETTLNSMIPTSGIPEAVKAFFSEVKHKGENVRRNKELFERTGYWWNHDARRFMWEYSNDKTTLKPEVYKLVTGDSRQLSEVVEDRDLFNHIESLLDTEVKIVKGDNASYDNNINTINIGENEISRNTLREVLVHEIDHHINDQLKGSAGGSVALVGRSDPSKESMNRLDAASDKLNKLTTSEEYKNLSDEFLDRMEKARRSGRDVEPIRDWYNSHDIIKEAEKLGSAYNVLKEEVNSEGRYRAYQQITGEMQSRLVEERLDMTPEQRRAEAPWETLDKMLAKEGLPKSAGMRLYSNFPGQDMWEGIKKLFKDVKENKLLRDSVDITKLTDAQRAVVTDADTGYTTWLKMIKVKEFDMSRFINRSLFHSYRALHDQAGLLLNGLVKKYGKEGHDLVVNIEAEKNSGGHADRLVKEMMDEAYRDVPTKLTSLVNAINLTDRLYDIYGYTTKKEFKGVRGLNAEQNAAFRATLDHYFNATPEELALARKASNTMFEHVKMWVDEMHEKGLINAEEAKDLKDHNYRKLKTISVEDLYDKKYGKPGSKMIRQTDSGIDSLGQSQIKLLETDTRILYTETARRIARRIDNQETKLAWVEFYRNHPDNPYVTIPMIDKVEGREKRRLPRGFVKDIWYEDGEKHAMYFSPDTATQLMSHGQHMSFPLTRALTNMLGVNLTRLLTVGTSAVWSVTRGATMDLMHTFFAMRQFDPKTGEYKSPYSKLGPVYAGQIGSDMSDVAHDVWSQGPKTGMYLKAGGQLPMLALRESVFMGRGVKLPGWYDKTVDALSWTSKNMEMWNRVATANRVLKNMARDAQISLEDAWKNPKMVKEATQAAVDRLPYGHGGWLVREVDKIIGPFITASYNATTAVGRRIKESPGDFTARMLNIALPTVGLITASVLYNKEAEQEIPEWVHTRSVPILFFPDSCSFIDEDGNKRWVYLKIPTDQVVAAMYNVFRYATIEILNKAGLTDREANGQTVLDAINSSFPGDSPMAPTIKGWLAYFRGIDPRTGKPIGQEQFSFPKSGVEGQWDSKVSEMAKTIGRKTGLSGPRLEIATKQYGIQNNEFTWLMGQAWDKAFNDTDPRLKQQHWAITLSQVPGLKNLFGITVPRAYRTDDRVQMKEDDKLVQYVRNGEFTSMAEGFYWKGVGKEDDLEKYIDKYEDEDPNVAKGLEKKKNFIENIKSLPNRSSWSTMFHTSTEAKATDFFKIWKASNNEQRTSLNKELDILLEAGYVSKEEEGKFDDIVGQLKFDDRKTKINLGNIPAPQNINKAPFPVGQ